MDEARAEELLGEYGEYSPDIKLGRVFGTCVVGEFTDLLRSYLRDAGDAATLRGFTKTHRMTPSMALSSAHAEYERGRKSVLEAITYTTTDGAIHNSFHDYVDLREKLQ